MNKITPFLWFDDKAEEAAHHYLSIFKNSRILEVSRYAEGGPMPAGTVLVVRFELDGQEFMALNAGPHFKFTEAISFLIKCKDQDEIDELWEKLCAGREPGQCGWLKDKFGLSWQVVPAELGELMGGEDPATSSRVMQALMLMTKIDIATLRRASEGF